MNPTALLSLISDLYVQVSTLTAENEALKAAASEQSNGTRTGA